MVHWTTDVDILKQKFMFSETIQLPSLFNTYPSDNKSVDLICDNLHTVIPTHRQSRPCKNLCILRPRVSISKPTGGIYTFSAAES